MAAAEKTRYFVVARPETLEPLEFRVHDEMYIPLSHRDLLPKPLEVTDSKRIEDVRSLPVGSVVAEQGGRRFQLTVKPISAGDNIEPQVTGLNDIERGVAEYAIGAYRGFFRIPSEADRSEMVQALYKETKFDIIRGLRRMPSEQQDIFLDIIREYRDNLWPRDEPVNRMKDAFAKELVDAVVRARHAP
ncbi:MAG: hypothetical protein NTU61_05140 [Candidatus Altiarchaeota archaeon]|nr:hypothetical protein [Candidatus Altiarchaeota archaeon]